MDVRFRLLLLTLSLAMSGLTFAADKNANQDNSLNQIIQQEPIIQPEVKRREVKNSDIASDNFEITAALGLLSIEDFGVNPVYVVRLDYHVTEDFFFEGSFGYSKAGTTSYETLSGGVSLLTDSQRDYSYYMISLGYNLFPGEAFVGRNHAYNTALYLIGGAGVTDFAGDNHFTTTVGAGYRVNFTDRIGMHLDVRDHIFNIDVTGQDKSSNNIEFTLGITYVF